MGIYASRDNSRICLHFFGYFRFVEVSCLSLLVSGLVVFVHFCFCGFYYVSSFVSSRLIAGF